MDSEERKKWLKWSKIGICVPLKDKDACEKDLHMANTLERLVNLQEEMATDLPEEKNQKGKTNLLTRWWNNIFSIFVRSFNKINVF